MPDILDKFKGVIYSEGFNLSKASKEAGMVPQNVLNKMSRKTLKATELNKICEAIGYKIEFVKDDKK